MIWNQPTRGEVRFDGRNVAELDGKELVAMRLRFGFLFQMAALFDSLTVFDNVAFGLREHHLCDEDEVRRIVLEESHRLLRVRRGQDLVAGFGKDGDLPGQEVEVVVDRQNLHRRRPA